MRSSVKVLQTGPLAGKIGKLSAFEWFNKQKRTACHQIELSREWRELQVWNEYGKVSAS
jgi:hypothetical protein